MVVYLPSTTCACISLPTPASVESLCGDARRRRTTTPCIHLGPHLAAICCPLPGLARLEPRLLLPPLLSSSLPPAACSILHVLPLQRDPGTTSPTPSITAITRPGVFPPFGLSTSRPPPNLHASLLIAAFIIIIPPRITDRRSVAQGPLQRWLFSHEHEVSCWPLHVPHDIHACLGKEATLATFKLCVPP